MELQVIDCGGFKLDGGAMFGVVPKSIWTRTNPADENNMISLATRCLLVQDGDLSILIDNGMGNKQSEKFFSYYYRSVNHSLERSLNRAGLSAPDITDMFMTHLHFDHCGGGVVDTDASPKLTFPNAQYWSNEDHWKWAIDPNAREKASFLKENIVPIQESGHLSMQEGTNFKDVFDVIYVDGHSEKQMLPKISYKGRTIVFVADLVPTHGHIPVPYVMGYDTRPLLSISEKKKFLDEAARNEFVLFFEHDPEVECCTVKHTERGVRIDQKFKLSEL